MSAAPPDGCDIEIRVRYAECDAMGYLHHANYFVFFEMGRTELLRLTGIRYRDMEERKLFYVVAKLDCRFRAPARYDDVLTLKTRVTRMTPFRVDHAYELRRDGQRLCDAATTLALVGADGRPTQLPDDLWSRMGVDT